MRVAAHLVALTLASTVTAEPQKSKEELAKLKLSTLKKYVFVRGAECSMCSSKADWSAKAAEVAHLPVDPELSEEWKAQQDYKAKVKDFKVTREEFIEQMNKTQSHPLEGQRAERLWDAFQRQLQDGTVEFTADGSVRFSLPISHHLAPHVHPRITDALEVGFEYAHALYMKLPKRRRAQLDAALDWLVETGALHGIVALLVTFLAVDFSISYLRSRKASSTVPSAAQ